MVSREEFKIMSETPRPSLSLTSKISIPETFTKTLSDKIENLVEFSRVPEDAQIQSALPPLLSPYNVFRRQFSNHKWSLKKACFYSSSQCQGVYPNYKIGSMSITSCSVWAVCKSGDKSSSYKKVATRRIHSSTHGSYQIGPYPSWQKRTTSHC